MSVPGPNGPGRGPHDGRPAGSAVWWVVAGVAALVILGLLAWLLSTGLSSPGSPTTTAPSTPVPVSATPTEPAPETSSGEDWGEFPPNHLDARKDLFDPQFPERVGAFELESQGGDSNSVYADYDDAENFVGFTAWVIVNANRYSEHIERLTDVDRYGRAVCGHPGDFPEQTDCYMVGAQHVIYVGTASDVSMEEMAALLEELYDAL